MSLHTWSGGYDQKDTLSWQCIDRDYHYIHPHFRGPNKTYEACGSPLALSDIEDAIDYALQHANVDTPVQNRMNSKLYIYAGVHDGYTGSVPITHSLNFYNKVVGDFDIMEKEALIPSGEIIELLASRGSSHPNKVQLGGRDIHLQKNYKDKIRVCIFEGGHEMLEDIALNHVEDKSILTIGDSNGEYEKGWVFQLQERRFEETP